MCKVTLLDKLPLGCTCPLGQVPADPPDNDQTVQIQTFTKCLQGSQRHARFWKVYLPLPNTQASSSRVHLDSSQILDRNHHVQLTNYLKKVVIFKDTHLSVVQR